VYEIAAQNDGNQTHTYTLKGTGNGGGFDVQYFDALTGGSDVTAQVTSTGLAMDLNAGEVRNIRVEVTPKVPPNAPPVGSFFDVFVELVDGGAIDRVKATTTAGNNEAPTVTGITPNSGLNSGVVNITDLSGTGFLTGATVKLLKTGQPDIVAGNVTVVNTTKITCDLDLTGASTGQWDVVVTNADAQSGALSNGFTVNGPPPTAVLRADYRFQNTLASSVGTPPALAPLGTGNAFATETVDGASHTVLQFPLGNGLTLSPTTGVIPSGVYTLVVLFRFDQVSNYRRIADFKNGFSDTGFYNLSSNLNFYNVATGAGSPIQANTYVQAVLTREATGQVVGYVNGVQQFAFQDSSNLAVIDSNNTLRFFRDDVSTPGEHSSGAVARIRTFDGALTPSQVAALDRLGSGLPAVSINDASVFEGNSGATIAAFTVSLSVPSSNSVQVSYATVDESATLVDGDYAAASGSLTFSPGTVSQPVTVTVIGDAIQEPDETFRVDLTNPVNAALARSQGIGTIRNDDSNQCIPPPPGLISWWPGEGNTSDQTGAHNGAPEGGLTFAAGRVGQAFKFNGADSGVSLGSWFSLQSFSVALWVNPGVSQVSFANILDTNHRTNVNWVVQQDAGNTNQYNWVPFDGGGVIPFSLRPNSWQYLVLTRDAGNVNQVYLDGQLVGSTTGLGPIPYNGSQLLRLGHWGGGARHFNGLMDEVDVFDRPLMAAEVQALFQAGSAGKCPGADFVPPTVASSTADNAIASVKVTFSEDVRSADAETLANFTLESPIGNSVSITATSLSYDLVTKTMTISGTVLAAGNTYKVTVTNVRDLAGNVIVNNGTTNISTGTVVDVVGPKVTGCQADNTQVVISFNEPLDPATVNDPSSYELRSPIGAANSVDLTGKTPQLDATNRQVTIPGLGLHNGDSFSVTVNNVRDAVGNTIAAPGNQCSGSVALTPGASLSEVSGNSQTGTAGQPLQDPFIVQVTAPTATTPVPVPGVTVRFIVAEGGGAFVNGSTPATSTTVMTDANGEAQATLTLGPKVATNRVTAVAPDLTGSSVSFTASSDAGGSFKVSLGATPNRTVQGGQSRVTAIVSDVNGNRTPDVPLQFAVIRGGGSLVGDSSTGTTVTATTNSNGKAEVDLTNITYGSNRVRVSDVGAGTLSSTRTHESERAQESELSESSVRSVPRIANTEVIEILGEFALDLTSGLNLIAVPFVLDDTDPAAVFQAPANQLKVAGWNEGANSGRGDYVFYNGSNLQILPGRGFWVQHPDESDLNIVRGVPVDANQAFVLRMNRGYELIGNPYPAEVPWNLADIRVRRGGVDQGDLKSAGLVGHLVEPYAWIWDAARQGYDLVFDPLLIAEIPDPLRETMRAFLPVGAGGWFQSNGDGVELVLPAPGNSQILRRAKPRIAPRKADNEHWGIEMIASAGGSPRSASSPTCSDGNMLGVIDSPLLGGQGLQVAKAPIAGALAGRGYVDLGFLGEGGALLAWDMRSTRQATRSMEGRVWRFQVTTNLANADVQITYPNLSLVPKHYRIFLTDEASGQKQTLRTTSLYSFRSQPSGVTQRTFRLEITEEIASRLRVANLAVVSTGRSLLPGVRISYGLSQPAKVLLRVRSVAGGVVYEIPAADLRAGLNSAMWDGRNATGAFTPRGVYLVELIARNDQGEEVKAVRSVTVR
ncbi:MAG: Ig-like domain-containing protein, partial [Armatimonadetes bacterium]|nr:Ig-like domain-containing protein [Armatimonadota bacterium]